jgi:hypothetical protein
MKALNPLYSPRCQSTWLRCRVPIAMLLAFLQRSPAVRLLTAVDEMVAASPLGAVLRSGFVAAASLGTLHSLAGATTLQTTQPSPVATKVGATVQVGFTVMDTINIGSWKIGGALPPGLTLSAMEGGAMLTGPGTLDATTVAVGDGYGTTPGNATTTPVLSGSPTQAGSYTMTLQAFELGKLDGLASNTFNYTIVVAASDAASVAPAFTTQPTGSSVTVGGSVTLTASASGSPAPSYQWSRNGTALSGATNATLTLNNVQLGDAGSYTVSATNSAGSASSNAAALAVTAATIAPTFSTQPSAQSATAGSSATLTAVASGSPAPAYQWRKDGTAISGATNASLTLSNVQVSDSGSYTVVATNSAGSATSNAAALTVTAAVSTNAPAIVNQPATQTASVGSTIVFNVDAIGSPAPTYQWRKDGVSLNGATNSRLVLSSVSSTNAGAYSVVVTNSAGSATSNAANLTVNTVAPSDAGRLINLAIRTNAGTDAQTLIVGFAIGGAGTTGTKPLLVRAVGPSLTQFGLTGALADPVATVFQGSATVGTNDNWAGDAQIQQRATQVGAFPLAASSLDAAFALTPSSGGYSVQVSGKAGSTGIALAEIYDATASTAITATTPRLVNASARTQVGTGNDILIAGFVLSGTTSRTVMIRATGPAIAAFGVAGVLADPKLQLFSGSTMVRENDNWGGDAQIAATAASVGAFALTDNASKDAVLLVTLAPGAYTAQVSGVGNTTGVALIELYEVP